MKYCPKCKTEYEDWVKLCADCEVILVDHLPVEAVNEHQSQNFVTVYTHPSILSVELVKTAIESKGIKCFIKGFNPRRADTVFGFNIELQVAEKDKQETKEIMKELDIK